MGFFHRDKQDITDEEQQEAIQAVLELAAMMEQRNENNGQVVDEEDALREDYGYAITNPVYVKSIMAGYLYLAKLQTEAGEPVQYRRQGSTHGPTGAIVDIYTLYVNGEALSTLYICPCGRQNAVAAPKGLRLR